MCERQRLTDEDVAVWQFVVENGGIEIGHCSRVDGWFAIISE